MRALRLLAAPLLLIGLLTACDTSEQVTEPCAKFATRPDCYTPSDVFTYCYLNQLRDLYRHDEYRRQDLPRWADTTMLRGAPVIVDIPAHHWPFTSGELQDQLDAWRKKHDIPPNDQGRYADCVLRSGHQDVVDLYGPPQDPPPSDDNT